MKFFMKNIPEQVKRLVTVFALAIIVLLAIRSMLIPKDFGEYGHYRGSALREIASKKIHYAGREICNECHDDVAEIKKTGFHKNVACEICHGPAAAHTEDPESVKLQAPRERGYCPLCHEYHQARPTGFPQIISVSHNPIKACISCHNPHDPKPPATPKECSACHGEIARTKSLSKHVNVSCTTCHETPEEHKLRPRDLLPDKPATREFCGKCHAEDALSEIGIPRIDMATHGLRYVCWQCHYPHLPEAK